MSDIIHLLPDSVANQIAAGEVIQRPASVVKELMENAIDAGATKIQVVVKDAGRTSILVIDDGKGMSETDVRMAFERHATSKITQVQDLFSLRTMGFRGEALASIAAIASVEVRTRLANCDCGTFIEVAASKVLKQEPCSCPEGTSFLVKNLFFNVPARRKFLKSNETEMRQIIQEFQRIVLVYPEIHFELLNGDDLVYELPKTNLRQRITAVFGKKKRNFNQQLVQIEAKTAIGNISGFIGTPEFATKNASQYFFVNGRYMRHPYFHRAVVLAYEQMLRPDTNPTYFIFFEMNPSEIDVNIHPTKTEIKFENERELFTILMVCIKEALGKFNVVPSIDFDTEGLIDIPVASSNRPITPPQVTIDHTFNPFKTTATGQKQSVSQNWEDLYQGHQNERRKTANIEAALKSQPLFYDDKSDCSNFFQYKEKYIITSVKSGLMIVDQQRAMQRILFEELLAQMENQQSVSQKLLFPEVLELNAEDAIVFEQIKDKLTLLGFDLEPFGKQTYSVNSVPALLANESNIIETLINLIADAKENDHLTSEWNELLALRLAKSSAKSSTGQLRQEEMSHLIDKLFVCKNSNLTPDGKKIVVIVSAEEIEKRF
ncbi:MAG TPA: DNA mismatch repair endonuclease MutL [Paludibacteraceae bacterium]|nr:DNA mismatch repair endonuclease MutL [Paludibacteraceae bacterium]